MLLILLGISVGLVLLLLAVNRVPLSYTLRNLSLRWRTTLMTALAFTLVIGLMVVMLAFTTGMQRMMEGSAQPGNVVILAEGAIDEIMSNLNVSDLGEIENLPYVRRDGEGGRPWASRETYLIVKQPVPHPKPGRPTGRFLQVRGITDAAMAAKVHNIQLQSGAWFSAAGVEDRSETDSTAAPAIQAVLGEGVASELAADRTAEELAAARNPRRLDVGDHFRLGEKDFVVTGILKSSGAACNSEIWANRINVGPVFGKENVTTLVLATADADAAVRLRDFLKQSYAKANIAPQVEKDYYASLSETNQQFFVAIMIVTAVMSAGGVFGVMNTMFAAISNRIKDIGVLRILGYARWHILVSFLLESLVIALLGGVLGCALGSLANGTTVNSVMGAGGGGKFVVLELVVDANIWTAGIFLTLLMGGFGGLVPALSAVRLKPLDALR
ncbi:MAG: ABC transporter permease [Thermoguttaceae bacterium]